MSAKPEPRYQLIAVAVGAAARILRQQGYSQKQSAELMRHAWRIVGKQPPRSWKVC